MCFFQGPRESRHSRDFEGLQIVMLSFLFMNSYVKFFDKSWETHKIVGPPTFWMVRRFGWLMQPNHL